MEDGTGRVEISPAILIFVRLLGILGTKEYRKPSWVTQMEEMQEALKGKSESDGIDCMLSEPECSFSTDSLDDRAIRDESSQRDSSTMISEFSSTRTLMNIDDEGKRCFDEEDTSPKGFFLSRRHSDSMEVEQESSTTEYSWEMNSSSKQTTSHWIETSEDIIGEVSEIKGKQILARKIREKVKPEKSSKEATRKERTTEERTVAWKGAEAKSLSTAVSVKVKRDSVGGASKSSGVQKTKLQACRSPVLGKSASRSPMRATRNVGDSNASLKSRSPSPKGSKYMKPSDSPSTESQRSARVNQSTSATRSEKQRHLTKKEEVHESHVTCKTIKGIEGVFVEYEGSMESLQSERRKKIVLDFDEFPPPRSEKKSNARMHSDFLNVPEPGFYLSPIEENSEASTGSGQSKAAPENIGKPEPALEYDHSRKYHTYPKSRIPVARWSKERRLGNLMMDPKMYPLEPREIDLEAFQQLHTADSQEELQEFLLLESQCSGNLGLAGNMSTSEASCSEHHSEDERGTMSGTVVALLAY